MKTKILVIGIIRNKDRILMRKKPNGSPPYKETWYLFGGELTANKTPKEAIKEIVKKQTGINIKMGESIGWDTETKKDLDDEIKFFVYLDVMCEYSSGELKAGEGIERLEWIPISKLKNYDLVPPSRKLFKKIGYLK